METVQAAIVGDEALADYWRNNNDSFTNLSRLIDKPTEIHVAIVSSPTPKPSPTPIPSPTLTPMPEGLLFYEDFESWPLNNQVYPPDLLNVVEVEDGNKVNHMGYGGNRWINFGSRDWKDYAVEFDFMILRLPQEVQDDSKMDIFIRSNKEDWIYPRESYLVDWSNKANRIGVSYSEWKNETGYSGDLLGGVDVFRLKSDVWYHIKVEVEGNNIRLYIDNNLKLSVYDPQVRLDSGFAGIQVLNLGTVIVDNIRVEEIP